MLQAKDFLEGCVPYPEEFKKLYREKGYWEDKTLGDVLDESIKKFAAREAMSFGNDRVTYAQMGEKIDRLALHFLNIGLKPLDRVIFQLANTMENVYTLMGLIKAGIIPILALPAHRFTEIDFFIGHSKAVATFTPTGKYDYVSMVEKVQENQPSLKYIFVQGEPKNDKIISLEKLLATPIEDNGTLAKVRPDPDQVAFMILSGGTTGIPKMIPRTHNDYVYNVKACGAVGKYDENTVFLAVLPMGHNYTLGCPGYLAAFYVGGKTVVCTGLDEETVFSTIAGEKVTHIASAGPLIARWVVSPAPANHDTSSLKIIQNGGARLAPEMRLRLRELFNCHPQEVYGTGEGLINICPLDAPDDMVINSSGKPVSPGDEIRIIDDNDKDVPVGAIGELIIRGPYNIRGYYKAEETNKTAFIDGYYRMGDLVRMNDQGYLFVEGRKKDMINRGGEKISCEEVENYVLSFPKVENVSMIAMPDKVFGEKACACVVPKKGESFDLKELVTFLKTQNIAAFKLPERLEILEAFPISPAGKILKRNLVDMVTKKLKEEGAI